MKPPTIRLLPGAAVLLVAVTIVVSVQSSASVGKPIPSEKQAVQQAIELSAGRDLFAKSIEIATAKQAGGNIVVLFRRPTSDVMVSPGRKATKRLFQVTFSSRGVTTKILDKELTGSPSGKGYTPQKDKKRAQVISTALSHLWDKRRLDSKEFEVDVREEPGRFSVLVSDVPYTPDAFSFIQLTPDLKIINREH